MQVTMPRCAPFINVGLVTAKSYYQRMGRTSAYAIVMAMYDHVFMYAHAHGFTVTDPSIRLSWIKAN